jgi:hypothetical protein
MESAAAASRHVRRRWVAAAAAWGEGGGVGSGGHSGWVSCVRTEGGVR